MAKIHFNECFFTYNCTSSIIYSILELINFVIVSLREN